MFLHCFQFFIFVVSNSRRPAPKSIDEARRTYGPISEVKDFSCDICFVTLDSEQALRKHRSLHSTSWWPQLTLRNDSGKTSINSPPQPHRHSDTASSEENFVNHNASHSPMSVNSIPLSQSPRNFSGYSGSPSSSLSSHTSLQNQPPRNFSGYSASPSSSFSSHTSFLSQSPRNFSATSSSPLSSYSSNCSTPSPFKIPVPVTPSKLSTTPTKYLAPLNLSTQKNKAESSKNIPKSQQKLLTCTFCFLPLESQSALNTHLVSAHSFHGSVSPQSKQVSQNSAEQDSDIPQSPEETFIKAEPGLSPFGDDDKSCNKKLKCSKCSFKNNYEEVKQHQTAVHTDCEYMCDYSLCTFLFAKPSGLRKHLLKLHDEPDPYVCEICENMFSVRENYENHVCGKSPVTKGKSYICAYKCGYRSRSQWDVKRHSTKYCILNKSIVVKCKMCKNEFKQGDMPAHKEVCEQEQAESTRRKLRQRDGQGKVV